MAIDHNSKATPETPAKIHNRLRVLRAERGLSRVDLATAVGVNYQTIGYLERGDYSPSLELAFRLSEYFSLPVEAIFSLQPFPPLSSAVYRSQHSAHRPGLEES
jgi:putative transcriptional regulator